ncbi:MAG TPA: hypothetical protein VFN09_12545, partial [Rhodanobacteraceae bacterium]|nr:hypothetical protein [Rhodanobacteraceae bacterium]
DGIGDMAIGMPGGSASNGRVGAIFVLPGHAGAAPAWPGDVDLSAAGVGERWNGVAASAVADTSQMLDWPALSMGGDVNGDGKPDLAIGSVRAEATDPVNGPWQGRVWLPIGPPFLDRIFRDGFELPTPP